MKPELIQALTSASNVAVLTGAGVSAESGIPTFRDAQTGLWSRFRPEDLATPEAFERDPKTVWEWYAWRREQLAEVDPNPGHAALAEMERHFEGVALITQNVDGLHQKAGSSQVIELHGNIRRSICHRTRKPISEAQLAEASGVPPRSPHAPDGLARPDVVWFGEMLPARALNDALAACSTCEVFFSVGTSSLVEPAASLAFAAREAGALVVEVNPDATPLSRHADFVLRGKAGEILPQLLAALDAA
ncbi:MAG: NAD-dependent deacylase [Xanthomonadales bacterium]|nr:NAD-dependent deacylase [Xanthomonadales bacterium]